MATHSFSPHRPAGRTALLWSGGFTLVELMVVVLVIGILVAIAVPVFLNVKAQSAKASCQASQRMVASAVEVAKQAGHEAEYVSETGQTFTPDSYWGIALTGRYLQRVPTCPVVVDGFTSVYCIRVGPKGWSRNGAIYADHWRPGEALWSADHSLGLPSGY